MFNQFNLAQQYMFQAPMPQQQIQQQPVQQLMQQKPEQQGFEQGIAEPWLFDQQPIQQQLEQENDELQLREWNFNQMMQDPLFENDNYLQN